MPLPATVRLLPLAALLTGPVLADTSGTLESESELSPFYLRVGTYVLDSSTTARVDGQAGIIGTRLSFEDDLNLDKSQDALLVAGRWRFGGRHFMELEHFYLKRNGSKRLATEIRFGDTVYPIGVDLNSSFTTEVTRIGYAYRIVKRPEWGLALSAGLHVTRLRASLDELVFGGASVPTRNLEVASVTAPLPVFGFSGARRFGKKWTLAARGQFFFLEVDDVEGSVTHASIHIEHNTFRHLGFGAGYDWFGTDITATDRFWRGSADVEFNGPMLFIHASF